MNWDDLRLFLAVAREGSISGAARVLAVQHSTVSRRMQGFEKKLGVRLIERKKSGYELTPAGENLREAAGKIEHEILEIDANLVGRDAELSGELRVSATTSMASGVLMPMFGSFNRRYPEVELHIDTTKRNISLSEREADVAIRLTNTPTPNLIGHQLGTVATAAYGNRDYLSCIQQERCKPKWLGVACCGFHQSWTKKKSGSQRHSFYVDEVLLTISALKTLPGIAYLPCIDADRDPTLARFAAPEPEMNLGLWLLYHPDLKRTARVQAFRDHMIEEVRLLDDQLQGRGVK